MESKHMDMAKWFLVVGCVLGCLVSAGCSAEQPTGSGESVTGVFAPIADATAVEIYVLDPQTVGRAAEREGEGFLRGFAILDRGPLPLEELPALLNRLGKGVADNPGEAAKCFNPRHGMRLTLADRTVDLVICFECLQIYEYDSTRPDWTTHYTTEEPTAMVNALFRRVGLSPLERS